MLTRVDRSSVPPPPGTLVDPVLFQLNGSSCDGTVAYTALPQEVNLDVTYGDDWSPPGESRSTSNFSVRTAPGAVREGVLTRRNTSVSTAETPPPRSLRAGQSSRSRPFPRAAMGLRSRASRRRCSGSTDRPADSAGSPPTPKYPSRVLPSAVCATQRTDPASQRIRERGRADASDAAAQRAQARARRRCVVLYLCAILGAPAAGRTTPWARTGKPAVDRIGSGSASSSDPSRPSADRRAALPTRSVGQRLHILPAAPARPLF